MNFRAHLCFGQAYSVEWSEIAGVNKSMKRIEQRSKIGLVAMGCIRAAGSRFDLVFKAEMVKS